jgi:hypothetical protein
VDIAQYNIRALLIWKTSKKRQEVKQLIYGVIVRTEPEATEHMCISYEDVLRIMIDRLLSDEQLPLTIWRRCCSSVHEHTMSVETCNAIRDLAGVNEEGENTASVRKKLDTAVNNWYLRGEISLSDENLVKPFDACGSER